MKTNWALLPKIEQDFLIANWQINWCWAKKGLNFDPYIEWVEKICWLDNNFAEDIIEEVCYPHDYDYLEGITIFDKLKADLILWVNLFETLRLYKVGRVRSLFAGAFASLVLILFGHKAFYFEK